MHQLTGGTACTFILSIRPLGKGGLLFRETVNEQRELRFTPALLSFPPSVYTPLPRRPWHPPPEGKEPRMDLVGLAPEQVPSVPPPQFVPQRTRRRARKALQTPLLSVV